VFCAGADAIASSEVLVVSKKPWIEKSPETSTEDPPCENSYLESNNKVTKSLEMKRPRFPGVSPVKTELSAQT
jgi:hypothetical protein